MSELQNIIDEFFLKEIKMMKAEGWSERQIAKKLDISVSQLRAAIAVAKEKLYSKKEHRDGGKVA